VIFSLAHKRRKRKLASSTMTKGKTSTAMLKLAPYLTPITGEEMETTKETPEPRRSPHVRAKPKKHQTKILGRDPPHALSIAKAEEQKPSTLTIGSCNRVTAAGEAPNRANPRRTSRRCRPE
jgi:hypothetical protein